MINEIWKDIPEFEGYYQASNLGRIRTVKRQVNRVTPLCGKHILPINEKIRKLSAHTSGYLRVSLTKNGCVSYHYVHVLVAATFLGKKPDGHDVDHRNTNRKINSVDNLRYLTIKDNRGFIGNTHAVSKSKKINYEFSE